MGINFFLHDPKVVSIERDGVAKGTCKGYVQRVGEDDRAFGDEHALVNIVFHDGVRQAW
jgi:hypothetical protein